MHRNNNGINRMVEENARNFFVAKHQVHLSFKFRFNVYHKLFPISDIYGAFILPIIPFPWWCNWFVAISIWKIFNYSDECLTNMNARKPFRSEWISSEKNLKFVVFIAIHIVSFEFHSIFFFSHSSVDTFLKACQTLKLEKNHYNGAFEQGI